MFTVYVINLQVRLYIPFVLYRSTVNAYICSVMCECARVRVCMIACNCVSVCVCVCVCVCVYVCVYL